MRRLSSTILAGTIIVAGVSASANTQRQDSGPNVILIVTDDQGYGDMSCHGNPWLQTPNLDRLYAESVRLEDYHVEPVCTPTRAALMTGRYSSRVGAWTVTQGRQLLKPSEVTMAEVFSDSGYRTGMFGKWHLGDPWPYAPRFRGFQTVVRHLAGGIDEIGKRSTKMRSPTRTQRRYSPSSLWDSNAVRATADQLTRAGHIVRSIKTFSRCACRSPPPQRAPTDRVCPNMLLGCRPSRPPQRHVPSRVVK